MTFVNNKNAKKISRLVRNYQKSLDRYVRAVPDVLSSEVRCNSAKEKLVELLLDVSISTEINKSLSAIPKSNAESIANSFSKDDPDFQDEVKIASDFGASRNNFLKQFDLCSLENQEPVSTVEEIVEKIETFHAGFISGVRQSRGLEKNEKKRVKKIYLKMANKVVFGSGCITLNVFTFTLPMSHFVASSFFAGAIIDMIDLKVK